MCAEVSQLGACRFENGAVRTAFRIGSDFGPHFPRQSGANFARQSAGTLAPEFGPGNLAHDNRIYVSKNKQRLAMTEPDRVIVRSPTEAREGVTGHNVRYVLAASLAAVIIVFAGLWLYFFAWGT